MTAPGLISGFPSREGRMGLLQLTPDQNLKKFTVPGTYFWMPPKGLLAVRVLKVDSGSGGGSGRADVSTTVIHSGGGAGAGGAASDHTIILAHRLDLFAPWEIIVPMRGLGGAAVASAANGNIGTAGALAIVNLPKPVGAINNSVYALTNGSFATPGAGGTQIAAAGGLGGVGQFNGGPGGASNVSGLAGVAGATLATLAATGGGSGGGLTAANATASGGNGAVFDQLTGISVTNFGIAGSSFGAPGQNGAPSMVGGGWGTGAGGGASSGTAAGGNGGDGILGSGGGGGGAGNTSSGKGGDGGDGAIFIFLIW